MRRSKTPLSLALLATTALTGTSGFAGELPTGGSVAYGSVGISQNASTMTMQQSSSTAIVNWQSFSVGQGNAVNIQQPSSSAAMLNRVTGSTTSSIAGQINANGQVYLVNPNGILITPTGAVRASGFVASTLGISDADFIAGNRTFSGNGNSAKVTNQGTIDIGQGGYAALIGGAVDNSGTISVPLGKVGLGAGERATLDLSGDGFLQVAVPSTGPATTDPLIRHSGVITANGGRVEMQAATARDMARNAINLSGTVEARTVGGRSGAIILGGGEGGTVTVTGKLIASGSGRTTKGYDPTLTGKGGKITITGKKIVLTGAELDASGTTGGGTIRVGGDYKGGGTLQRADETIIDANTVVNADATQTGNGGSIVLWSDRYTDFGGTITARGGAYGGDGGFAEVSSAGVLSYWGFSNLSATSGAAGTLLLDPYNVTIVSGAGTTNNSGATSFTPTGTSTIGADLINAQLAGGTNVTISTAGAGADAGNIAVNAPIIWGTAAGFTLNATNNIAINAAITGTSGSLSLLAGGAISAGAAVQVGTFTLNTGNWTQIAATLPVFTATNFQLLGGTFLRATSGDGSAATPYTVADVYGLQGIGSLSLLASRFSLANPIDANVTAGWTGGFKPIGSSPASPFTGAFLGNGFTISGLTIGSASAQYAGLFGATNGASIANLTLGNVNVTGSGDVGGLVGNAVGTTITNVAVSGSVSAAGLLFEGSAINVRAGGIVGFASGGTSISGATANVTVTSTVAELVGGSATLTSSAGGILGASDATGATISGSSSSGSVTASGGVTNGFVDVYAGGIVGNLAGGSITTSQSSATVSAGAAGGGVSPTLDFVTARAGGLAGFSAGTITSSSASGAVTGQAGSSVGFATAYAGGLVGETSFTAPLSNDQASGSVSALIFSATPFAEIYAGGLVGFAGGDVTASSALGSVSATSLLSATTNIYAGGLTGDSNFISLTNSAAGGAVTVNATSPDLSVYAGGLSGMAFGTVQNAIATGPVSVTASASSSGPGIADVGGLIGYSEADLSTVSASGPVSAFLSSGGSMTGYVGGLLGLNTSGEGGGGTVTVAYATGAVNASLSGGGTLAVGGLAGANFASLNQTYATGAVSATGATAVGGLVGDNALGIISASFWDTQTTGQASAVGSAVPGSVQAIGLATLQFQDPTIFVPLAQPLGWNFETTWAPPKLPASPGYYPQAYAISPVIRVVTLDATRAFATPNPAFPVVTFYGGPGVYVFGPAGDAINLAGSLTTSALLASPAGPYPIFGVTGGVLSVGGVTYRIVATLASAAARPSLTVLPPGPPPVIPVPPGDPVPLLPTWPEIPNPPDVINYPGGGGPGGGPLPEILNPRGADSVEAAATDLESTVSSCDSKVDENKRKKLKEYTSCVSDALEKFADELDRLALDLPRPLRGVAATIREAARKVRNARSFAEARAAVHTAVVEVRKAIALLKADDPGISRANLRQGERIETALRSVETRLARAVGI